MTPRLLFLLSLLPLSAVAQLQLLQFDGTTETAVSSLYQIPSASPGDNIETRFHVRNNGTGPVSLQTLSIAGANFRISAAPSLPYVIAPTSFAEFKVLFSPSSAGSYSANLLVNSITLTIRGTAVPAAELLIGATPLTAGTIIDFGQTQAGTKKAQTLTLLNPGTAAVAISSITVTGAGFELPTSLPTPATLGPGQSATFQVAFAPTAGQRFNGSLSVDQRSFKLTGLGLEPPLPAASFQFSSSQLLSAQQVQLSIVLASPSQVAGTGTLTMEFHPSVSGVADDPAVLFLSGPPRIATVSVAPGDSAGKFGVSASLVFQTGTTAGTIVFTLKLGSSVQQSSLTIAPATITFDTMSGTRQINDLIVSLIGFDNTYSASRLSFTFYDSAGTAVPPGVFTVDVTQNFQTFFKTTQTGGAFTLAATFPVTGDVNKIGSVDVGMINSAGLAKTSRIYF